MTTHDQRVAYRQALRTSHEVRSRISVHDHNEDFLHWLPQPALGGQVDVDTKRIPERSLTLDILDSGGKLGFGKVFVDNFICVEYGVVVEELDKLVWHPVFFGPVTKLTPDSEKLTLEAESKEILLQEPVVWGRFIRSTGLGGNSIATWTLRDAHHNRNMVQAIRTFGPIRGGTWRVTFGKYRTDELDFDVGAAALETALEAVPGIGGGNVSVTGGPLGEKPFHVEFQGAHANETADELGIQDNTLTFDDDIRYAARFLRQLLRACGETRFAFGNFADQRLPKNFKLPKEPESIWSVCKRVVQAVNRDSEVHWRLYYDGAGVLRVENMAHGFPFDERVILNDPTTTYDESRFRNTVLVAVNRGNEARPVKPEIVKLRKNHPMSPYRLRRHHRKRYIVERIDNPHIRTPQRARAVGRAHLRRLSAETYDVRFDSMPIPIVTPGSRCSVEVDGERRRFTLDSYSLGITAHDAMSVGYTRRVNGRTVRPLHII